MYSKLFRLCSVVLVLVMLFNMLPMSTFAESITTSTTDNAAQPSKGEAQILGEDESRRTETQKHFRMSDGSFLAVGYGVPVHFLDDAGQWQEINNIPAMSAGSDAYTVRNGDVFTAYAANLSTGRVLTTSCGDAAVSIGLLDTAQAQALATDKLSSSSQAQLVTDKISFDRTVTAQVGQIDAAAGRNSAVTKDVGWTTEDLIPAGLRATTIYEDVFPGIDLQYTAFSHHIKEQIIVKERQTSYRYDFMLTLDGLSAVLNEDGSITLVNEEKAGIYTIPAPYMEDSAGAVSTDVAYTLTETKDGAVLTVTADKDWINDEQRVLPVRIDPTLQLNTGTTNEDIFAAFAMEAAPDDPTMDWQPLYVGNMPYEPENLQGLYRLFIHFNRLPSIPAGSIVTHAALNMYLFDFPGYALNEVPLAAYDVTTTLPSAYSNHRAWFKAITWRNQPQYDTSNAYDYQLCTSALGYKGWDLTDAAKSWYFEGSDPTIAIITEDESLLTLNQFRSVGFYAYGYQYPPILTVTYRSDVGLEDYYSYTPLSAGRAGNGYINNYTGNLVWVRNDMGFGGNRMPVSISHIYNANGDADNRFGLGNGWRTNYHQRVDPVTINNTTQYIWEDADGTAHYFFYDSGTYRDEDGLDLTMTISNGYIIADKYGNKSYFDTLGRLYKLENNQATSSSINITYNEKSQISTITDGAGRVYSFHYTGPLLDRISYSGGSGGELYYTTYTYSNTDLTAITDQDGKSSTFGYGSNHLLTSVTDLGGYKLEFTYQSTATGNNSRVVSVNERDGAVAGGSLSIEYAHNQTTFRDVSGNVQIMQFNNWGNMVSVQDGEGRAQYARYAKDENTAGKSNQLTLSSKLQNTVGNHAQYSSYETDDVPTAGDPPRYGPSTEAAYQGNRSFKISAIAPGYTVATCGRTIIQPGETYTFSAYMKTENTRGRLSIYDGNAYVAHGQILPMYSDWTRLEVSYTNTTGAAQEIRCAATAGDLGVLYVDCAQVERAHTASRYNLVENGDFKYNISRWSGLDLSGTDGICTLSAAAPELEETVFRITGNPRIDKHMSQTINISGNGGDSFVLAGWAKGDSAPLRDNREFAILGTFHYTDGTTGDFKVEFNADADSTINWQYSSAQAVAEKAYNAITVTMAYDYNVNTVYFDGIQLYREEFGTHYTYKNGELQKVTDIQGGETEYIYNQTHDVIQIKRPDDSITTYTYDDRHNVKTATTNEGVVYTFDYDEYGNNTSVSIGNGITATAAYTNNGNTLYQTTDAVGNITTYGYNANTNVLEWVKYPKDTDTTKTSYSYDSMYRMAAATAVTDTGTALTAGYTYTDDLLTRLQTGSTTYNFGYGNFDLRSSITIGSRTLAGYTYTDRTNYLSRLDYGNGNRVQYEYDQQGRVVSQTYEDGDTVTYRYDNSGALAKVTDSATGRKTTYYYDFTDRLMKYAESGSDYSHSVEYTYDNINNLTALVETINGVTRTTSYSYDDDNRITSVNSNGVAESYTYDSYGRVQQKVTTYGGATILTETYTYRVVSGKQTGQVATMCSTIGDRNVLYTYDYDSNGNITSVSDGNYTTTYSYDSANQLIRENNQAAGVTWFYTYDDAGNILSKNQYGYTTGSLGSATGSMGYAYGDSAWGDLLTWWNGNTITSDTIGNMLSDGTWSYTWEHGRELASMSSGSTTWSFVYDAEGMRTSRGDGSRTYSYVYNGGSLSQQTVDGHTLRFTYDASGSPLSVTYDGTEYYYAMNLQGDITAILDGSGTAVVQYTYDAWGNILSTTGTLSGTLGFYNPLRYRGYVYDAETGLYYLQSRYYNPAIGRFINADVDASTGHGLLGTNMFAYCANNPVNYTDATGQDWWHWAVAAAIVVAAAAAVVITAGGAAGAIAAITCVANGVAASTTGATVAAGVFIGSSTAFAVSAYTASVESDSLDEFAEYGESAMYTTGAGGFWGGVSSYSTARSQTKPHCFVAGTLVLTQNGYTQIQNISVGDLVWSWDEKTGTVLLSEVTEIYVSQTHELVHVFVNGEEIITTPEHPFYSPTNGWIEAINLHGGDTLILFNGNIVVVDVINYEILDSPVSVFNFQVNESHTYYVATLGVLVHNKCSGSYEIEFESGNNYVGKGSEARMNVSAKLHSTIHNDPVVSMKWEYAPDTQTAFVDEYFKMAVRGVNNDNTYNLIWSPGRKIFMNSLR